MISRYLRTFFVLGLLLLQMPNAFADGSMTKALVGKASALAQLRALIKQESHPDGLIVLFLPSLTGLPIQQDLRAAKAAGANAYIVVSKQVMDEGSPSYQDALHAANSLIEGGILLAVDYRHSGAAPDGYALFGHRAVQLLPNSMFSDSGTELRSMSIDSDTDLVRQWELQWKDCWDHSLKYKSL